MVAPLRVLGLSGAGFRIGISPYFYFIMAIKNGLQILAVSRHGKTLCEYLFWI